jgi:hypothetical protein
MGMANSDDDRKILAEHALMEHIKKSTPEYAYLTADMTEDQKIIYEHALLQQYLKRNE